MTYSSQRNSWIAHIIAQSKCSVCWAYEGVPLLVLCNIADSRLCLRRLGTCAFCYHLWWCVSLFRYRAREDFRSGLWRKWSHHQVAAGIKVDGGGWVRRKWQGGVGQASMREWYLCLSNIICKFLIRNLQLKFINTSLTPFIIQAKAHFLFQNNLYKWFNDS